MANLFNSTTTLTDVVETAFDRKVEWALRSVPQFRDVVDKRPEAQAMPGDVVVFTIHGDLALATTPLTETVDPDAVARPAPTRVSVTLNEYGNAELDTIRLRKLAFTDIADEQVVTIARNQADSLDRLVRNVMDTGTQLLHIDNSAVITSGGSPPGTYGNASAKLMGTAVARLRSHSVMAKRGDSYVAYIHPDVAFDLRMETGNTGWLYPHGNVEPDAIYRGEIGTFGGAIYIETPRTTVATGVYTTYMIGRQALAEANAVEPHTVVGPVVDKLKRFYPLGWYGLLGWGIFRQEALWQIKSASSISGIA